MHALVLMGLVLAASVLWVGVIMGVLCRLGRPGREERRSRAGGKDADTAGD